MKPEDTVLHLQLSDFTFREHPFQVLVKEWFVAHVRSYEKIQLVELWLL
jgi:hypothetical protein